MVAVRGQERVAGMKGWRNLILVVVAGTCVGAQAGWFPWVRGRRVDTLLITGNYAKSRLLAELFQRETKQPILLISTEGVGNDQMFFLPSVPEAMALEPTKYAEWVEYLQPARIVILGDEAFVAQSYVDQVRSRFPTVVLNSRNWLDNAKALGGLIKDRTLAKRYGSYFEKLDAAASGLGSGSPAVDEPLALPQQAPPVQP